MLKAGIEKRKLGMTLLPGAGARMLFWSPPASSAGIDIRGKGYFPLEQRDYGYWEAILPGAEAGDRYMVTIDEKHKIPDPVSLSQPDGVHEPSEVLDTGSFLTADTGWKGPVPADLIIYELHTGTFSPEGTFEGIINKLDYLTGLGINAIELMPVACFPGSRNWGYDGVYPFAVHHAYGGPQGLARLVAACHEKGIAVILDVVYNHLGPEGNYLPVAAPYFTDKYRTPWGSAVNLDDAWCNGVRRYFIENALMWLRDFDIDGLRLDAVHAMWDFGTKHFLAEMAESVEKLNRHNGKNHFLIAECDLNDVKFITPRGEGGIGLDTQWCDEFHHSLHAGLTGERAGYYSDFGDTASMTYSFNNAYVYDGKYSSFRKRIFGSNTEGIPGSRFIVCTQNHDQVGNRMLGERLSSLVDFESLKLAAGAMFFSPFVPMLFMGEEYGEEAPFLYFTSHGDKDLIEAVREGRKKEFSEFMSSQGPPDAQSEDTFRRSMLSWDFNGDEKKRKLLDYYKKLISLKKDHPALKPGSRDNVRAVEACDKRAVILEITSPAFFGEASGNASSTANSDKDKSYGTAGAAGSKAGNKDKKRATAKYDGCGITAIMNFSENSIQVPFTEGPASGCSVLLYSAHSRWGGPVNEFASLTGNDGMIHLDPRSILVLSDTHK